MKFIFFKLVFNDIKSPVLINSSMNNISSTGRAIQPNLIINFSIRILIIHNSQSHSLKDLKQGLQNHMIKLVSISIFRIMRVIINGILNGSNSSQVHTFHIATFIGRTASQNSIIDRIFQALFLCFGIATNIDRSHDAIETNIAKTSFHKLFISSRNLICSFSNHLLIGILNFEQTILIQRILSIVSIKHYKLIRCSNICTDATVITNQIHRSLIVRIQIFQHSSFRSIRTITILLQICLQASIQASGIKYLSPCNDSSVTKHILLHRIRVGNLHHHQRWQFILTNHGISKCTNTICDHSIKIRRKYHNLTTIGNCKIDQILKNLPMIGIRNIVINKEDQNSILRSKFTFIIIGKCTQTLRATIQAITLINSHRSFLTRTYIDIDIRVHRLFVNLLDHRSNLSILIG